MCYLPCIVLYITTVLINNTSTHKKIDRSFAQVGHFRKRCFNGLSWRKLLCSNHQIELLNWAIRYFVD